MSKLNFIGRPWVEFDATNREHRKWFAEFQEAASWKNCPVRFVVPDGAGDLVTIIQRSLIDYYVSKEFARASKVKFPAAVFSVEMKSSTVVQ